MKSKTKGNEFAYPIFDGYGLSIEGETGLTKREHFAATLNFITEGIEFTNIKALNKFLGRGVDSNSVEDLLKAQIEVEAKLRVMKADALIEALNKD